MPQTVATGDTIATRILERKPWPPSHEMVDAPNGTSRINRPDLAIRYAGTGTDRGQILRWRTGHGW